MPAAPDQPSGRVSSWQRTNFNTAAAILFVGLAVAMFVVIPHQIDEPLIRLSEDENALEATLFPRLVASGFLGLGILLFFKSFTIDERNRLRELNRSAITNVVVTLVAMAIYGPVLVNLGFVVSSVVLIAFLATFYGNRNYYLTAMVSIVVPIAIFYTFTKLLATYLPPFPIDTILTRHFIL